MGPYLKRRKSSRHRGSRSARPAYAALDLGTNNCRLLIARPAREGGFRVVDAFSRIVRLGEGLGADGRLSEPAMQRTIDALAVCAAKIGRAQVVMTRNVATEACRRARNCDAFLKQAEARTGLAIEIISSGEEIRLVLQGCMPLLQPKPSHALVFDIGGGSTEVIWLRLDEDGPDIIDWISLPLGVVNLSERFDYGEIPATAYRQLVEDVDSRLSDFCERHGIAREVARGNVQMLGTSGTVTTLAGVRLDLPRYNRAAVDGAFLAFSTIAAISERLRNLDCAGRAAQPCIGTERADLVVAGCAVLEAICARWPVGRLRVADRGIREGILNELMASTGITPPPSFDASDSSAAGHGTR
jgi:exopolyphosphatase/guanosine-5'-triphosphate,3'-diphosphate pyrophosphatase